MTPPPGADPVIGNLLSLSVAQSALLTTALARITPGSSSSILQFLKSLLRAFGLGALRERQRGREEEEREERREGEDRELGGAGGGGGGGAECSVSRRLVLNMSSQSDNWCLEGRERERHKQTNSAN